MAEETPRFFMGFYKYTLVTGANRGIGLEICKQSVSNGIRVVLTSRDEKKGLEAVETLKKEPGVSDQSLVYYGPKRMCEVFVPLLQLSDSPRIVNVSSSMGKLEVKTKSRNSLDINFKTGVLSVEEGASSPVRLALLP